MSSLISRAARHTVSYPPVAIWVLVAVGASVMGPFGTYSGFSWLARTIYWFSICGSAVFLSQLVRGGVGKYIRDEFSWRFDATAIVGMTLVFTPFVFALTRVTVSNSGGTPPGGWRIALFVFLVSALISTIRRIHRFHQLADTGQEKAPEAEAQPDATPHARQECRLHQRLPQEMRAPILHLSARDHFVDVETETALYSLRLRFADAVAEMDGVEGYITHRSHWIAADAIRAPKREGGKLFVVLCNGTEVPVSRTFRPRLEAAGVL